MKLFFDKETKQWTLDIGSAYAVTVCRSYILSACKSKEGLVYKSKPALISFGTCVASILFYSLDQSAILECAMYLARKACVELELI
jgi:hypothetical protein